jgi:Protein of unknown function (DUF4232)
MIKISHATRRAATVAAVACGGVSMAALVAACGSATVQATGQTMKPAAAASSGTSSPPASTSPTASAAASTHGNQCPSSALRVVVSKTQGGAAAGTDYVPLNFTNISGHSCAMYGFPGVSWVTGQAGSQIGNAASRQTSFGAVTVTLAAGATAHAWIGIADAGNFPPATCHEVTAHWLRIYPPGQYGALYTPFTSQVCSAKITGGSTPLTIMPVRAGAGTSGSVP